MNISKTKSIFIILSCVFFSITCTKEKTDVINTNIQTNNSTSDNSTIYVKRNEQPIILGKHKQNPFTVANMKRALDTLKTYAQEAKAAGINLKSVEDIDISATDLYVRVQPTDSSSLGLLTSDTTLTLFNFPLDYEILQDGEIYYDSTSRTQSTWLYTTVKPDYQPPAGVKYEVLSDLFLIEHTENFSIDIIHDSTAVTSKSAKKTINSNAINALYAVAFAITGNENEINKGNKLKSYNPNCAQVCWGRSWWRVCFTWCTPYYTPEGTVKLNTNNGVIGAKGVKVRMWNWFTYTDAYTNANGYFKSPSNFYSWSCWGYVDYHIRLDGRNRMSWDIRNTESFAGVLSFLTDYYNAGNHSANNFDIVFDTNTEFWGKTVINNAIYDYVENAVVKDGLTTPPNNLVIACAMANGDFSSSAPLLNKYINYSFTLGFSDTWLGYTGGLIGGTLDFLRFIILGNFQPDLILRYSKNISDYSQITHTTWHELTHASQLECMKNQKGLFWVSNYWSENVYRQVMSGKTYGSKGDPSWQIIALSEGWANYREKKMANTILYDNNVNNKTGFPYYYMDMYNALVNLGCSYSNIEKSLSTYSVPGFRDNLISFYPNLSVQITQIIHPYE